MNSIKEQGDFWTLTHQVTQSGMLTRIGLLKSGNLIKYVSTGRLDNKQPLIFFTQHRDRLIVDDDDMDL